MDETATSVSQNGPYTLSADARSVSIPIGGDAKTLESYKFVRITVSNVTNPHLVKTSFEVWFQPDGGDQQLLGSFGLYPPNNPGTFLVATQGHVTQSGRLSVTLAGDAKAVQLDTAAFQITIDRVELVNE